MWYGRFAVATWLMFISASTLPAHPHYPQLARRYDPPNTNRTDPLFDGTAYEQIYWQPDKVNITGIDGFAAVLNEAFNRFNDTILCTTPYQHEPDPDPERDWHSEHLRLFFLWKKNQSYFYSSVIHCKDSYSIRLFNFRTPQVPLYDGRLDVRIFCRHALENAQKSVDIMEKEWGLISMSRNYTEPHVPYLFKKEPEDYMLCGATLWTEDLSWGVILGYEESGCPKAVDDHVILTDSSWVEGF
ncbi:hypothetical protein ABW19_dt0200808 [Dactylella cylindrospora]|nr:hypothetical protein ABW19_dt0200808 [Dactylella cylindrospora]